MDIILLLFYLAGGLSSQHIQGLQRQKGQQGRQPFQQQESFNFQNIFAGFDNELSNSPCNLFTPEEEQQQWQPQQKRQGQRGQQGGGASNGLEEKICSSKILYNLDAQREADIFSRQAGKLNMVNEHKLPILSYLDLSAEKGHFQQNALLSPHWSINSHTIVYVLRGDAQFFASTARAGQNGFEWVAFKTNKSLMKSPVAGYTSVFRAMPLQVISNAYKISPSQAQNLKTNRETESILLSPQWTGQQRS
ncbi:11-S seed storage protein, conserved site-containing protein [Artemisia annua]|uniref:11-S seed storage protein, conserved site-containing protein n=1 Tax=Artemisia annua TaxID=35608 RepID=A0A2U1MQK3_ARTAN|nr:11-S seed storage protein, conserved site-containing protein [Artemisia annua]